MKTKNFHRVFAVFLSAALFATSNPLGSAFAAELPATETDSTAAETDSTVTEDDSSTTEPTRVSVHDPSIIKADGTYYLFGSHLADAKSTDLIQWTQMNVDWNFRGDDSWKNDSVYGEILVNLSESFAWAGYDDGDWLGGRLGVWAPDVIYNPYYEWEDSSKGAYMLYYSTSSTWRRSCIGYAVSKNVEGPYQYVDTMIYSGFTQTGEVDGGGNRNTKWDNDYLNLTELIGNGSISDISDNWFNEDGSWNHFYAPNAIDPTVFFSKEGKMYMVYGSWSGGLFIHELDKATGAVIYPRRDKTEAISGNYVDRYFGTHIAGGNHESGEGPYILYDEETDYYYLYETYGGLLSDGGYNMRLFRSRNVYGPYTDAAGNNAADSGSNNDQYGIKLIGNYAFSGQPGYRSAGHNSALIDDDGQRYLFYHQRFDVSGFNYEGHEVRVRKQYMNEDQWPVATVYEYRGEKIGHYSDKKVIGTYEVINHGTDTSSNMITPQNIELCSDGTVIGDMTGTWTKSTASGNDYDYITLDLDGTIYKGVLCKQLNEESPAKEVMTFSAIGSNNTCLWGSNLAEYQYDEDDKDDENKDDGNQGDGNQGDGNQNGGNQGDGNQNGGNQEDDKPPVITKKAQVISANSVYTKTYGQKAFSLNAKLKKGDGTLRYVSSNSKVAAVNSKTGRVTIKGTGIAKITITASETENYKKQQKTVTVKVAPKKTSLTSVKSKSAKKAVLKWKAASKASGYRIQFATNSKFKSARTITITKAKTTQKTISKLKSKKTYYFRIQPYKKSGNSKVYGAYSKAKKVKIK